MSWKTEHSVEVEVPRDRAWLFWTNVANWTIDPSIESVETDGPFSCGVRGETTPKGGEPVSWIVVDIEEGERAVIEARMPGGVARFTWRFEEAGEARTRVTQHVALEGPEAHRFAEEMGPELERGMREGMERLAEAMER